MAMKEASGCVGGGCGTFSLLGILLGVGLTAFLGARVMGDINGGGKSPSGTTAVPGLALSRPGALSDGQRVVVTTRRLPADTGVIVVTCLNLDHDPLASGEDAPRCDDNTRVLARTDEAGHLRATYTIRRNVVIDSQPLDCSVQVGQCILRAVAVGGNAPPSVLVPLTISGG